MKLNNLINFLASHDFGVRYAIDDILLKYPNKYKAVLFNFIKETINENEIQNTIKNDRHFHAFGKVADDLNIEEHAMIWIGKNKLQKIIDSIRLEELIKSMSLIRPKPYNHYDLADIDLDKNKLVSLDNFDIKMNYIYRNNTVFKILSSLPSNNSMYWASKYILNKSFKNMKIRLDPFMVYPKKGYVPAFFKMYVYGKPPDIKKLKNINEIKHVRWMPDDIADSNILFTDAVWTPRDNQIHFICEEVPKIDFCKYRGSRYFHSILDNKSNYFIHIDAAIRIYSEKDLDKRSKCHVKNIGKIGQRIKVFQIEDNISLETYCNIAASYFVWNTDVTNQFNNN